MPKNLLLLSLLLAVTVTARLAADEKTATAQWITLGTAGGPPVHAAQSQIANALVVGDAVYLFDVGNGTLRQLAAAKLPIANVRGIFISHHHIDHVADLSPVLFSLWTFGVAKPVPVVGPPGTKALAEGLLTANAPTALAGTPERGPPKPPVVSVVAARDLEPELNEPTLVYEDAAIRVTAISVDHFHFPPTLKLPVLPRSVAFRIEAGGRTFVFSGDTGPTKNLATLAKGADILITEVVDVPAIVASMRKMLKNPSAAQLEEVAKRMARDHLEPSAIGEIAAKAGVKKVVLTHYVPSFEDQPDLANYTRGIAPAFQGPVVLSRDLDRF